MKLPKSQSLAIRIYIICIFAGVNLANGQSVGISSTAITPDPSSILEIRTTTKGLLIPRMTTTERDAISSAATGLIIYNTITNKFNFYNGTAWTEISAGGGGSLNSVTGTANRINIGGTSSDPVIDISSSYVGQASITTLGTVTSGTWNATLINPTYGGTGVNNGTKTITLGGNLTTTGAHTTTFITSDNTNVTLPTTGTLTTLGGTETLTNKTLTSPVINSPTGLVKADVALGNVDNTSDATKNSAAATLTNKTISGANNTLSNIPNSAITDYIGYTINVQALTSAPADGQTIYFGILPKAPVTAAATSKVYVRHAGTITGAEIYSYSGTAGSAQAWSLYIRVNNTTDYLIQTLSVATAERVFTNSSLSISLSAGDYFEIKAVNPTWTTNPNTTIFGGYVMIN